MEVSEFIFMEFDDDFSWSYTDDNTSSESSYSDDTPIPCNTSARIMDSTCALCSNLVESKNLLKETFHMGTHAFSRRNIEGLVIMPIKYICLIRNDPIINKEFRHILVIPNQTDFRDIHPELYALNKIINA